jgi:hypothetical protein
MKIAVGLAFYQDFDSLRRMLTSLQAYPIDLLIAVDGKYAEHPAAQNYSSRECIDLFNSFQTPYRLEPAPSHYSERQKRQMYLDFAGWFKMDVLIIMDSDEYIIHNETDWDMFTLDLSKKLKTNPTYRQGYSIPVRKGWTRDNKANDGHLTQNLPRLFYNPGSLRYVDDHCSIRNRYTGVLQTFEGNTVCQHIMLGHDHTLRSKKEHEESRQYQEILIEKENAERQRNRDDFIRETQSTPRSPT